MDERNREIFQSAARALQKVGVAAVRKRAKWDFREWLLKHITIKDSSGRILPYSFAGHEPFIQIVDELHKYSENWFLKGTQIGFSTIFIGWNLYLPNWRGYDAAYALPDKVIVKPFMKTRFGNEQIQQNEALRLAYAEHESDAYYDCGAHYLYFLGANVLSEQLTKRIDQISLDEVTIIEKDAIERIQDRMDRSDFAQMNGFAMEIYPGGPADMGYQSGRQNVMLFKCPHCRTWQNIEEVFYQSSLNKEVHPKCVKMIDGHWQVVCVKCQKPYSRAECGKWVAKHPDREINSYRLPQVIFEGMNLDFRMRRWLKSTNKKSARAKLHSSMLAIPDAGDAQRITRDTMIRLKRDYDMRGVAAWSIAGMDMGDKCHAVWFDYANDELRCIWYEIFDADEVEEKFCKRMEMMNTQLAVIDGMPLTNTARAIAKRFPEVVRLNYYRGNELKEEEKEHLDYEFNVLAQDREQCLDAYCDAFTPDLPRVIFPAKSQEESGALVDFEDSLFAMHHYRGSQKDEVEDNRLGKKVFKFKKHVENHYFHAGAYALTAAALLAKEEARFTGMMPMFGYFGRE